MVSGIGLSEAIVASKVKLTYKQCERQSDAIKRLQSIAIRRNPSQAVTTHRNPSQSIAISRNPSQSVAIRRNQSQYVEISRNLKALTIESIKGFVEIRSPDCTSTGTVCSIYGRSRAAFSSPKDVWMAISCWAEAKGVRSQSGRNRVALICTQSGRNHMQSYAFRCNQMQSDEIRCNQVQSGAIRCTC